MNTEAMNIKRQQRWKKVTAAVALLTLTSIGRMGTATAAVAEGEAQAQSCAQGPEGSWLYSVVIPGLPFQGTETYAAGGGYIEADQLSQMPGSLATPGHGAWKKMEAGVFLLTYINLTFNADGTASGYSKVRQTATISQSCGSYSGSGDYAYYDTNGVPVQGASGTFTITARRIVVQAPQ